jgi:hypothetical protein
LELPGVTETGVKVHEAPSGSPEQLKSLTAKLYGAGFGLTVIVNEAACPAFTVASVPDSVKSAALMTSSIALELDAPFAAFPPYLAVMECLPRGRLLILTVALPCPSRESVASVVPPSSSTTWPVGVEPPLDSRLTVKLTSSPCTAVPDDELSRVVVG